MYARLIVIAAATLTVANPAFAEPAKPHGQEPATQPATRPAAVVLASADTVREVTPSSTDQAAPQVKRPRTARVTTCRCGDPSQASEQQ